MKKALSAVLALLMILSCMVFPTVAEEATKENTVVLSACDSSDGWPEFGRPTDPVGTIDTVNKTEGTGSLSVTRDGSGSVASFMFVWSRGQDLDISKMEYLVFDLYLSDVSMGALPAEIELHSEHNGSYGGWTDTHEVHVRPDDISSYFAGAPVAGWNKVVIPLSEFVEDTPGTTIYDDTKVSYFRMYLPSDGSNVGTAGTQYTMKLDNIYFTDTPYEVPTTPDAPANSDPTAIMFSNCDGTTGWSTASEWYPDASITARKATLTLDTVDKTEGKGAVSITVEGGSCGSGYANFIYQASTPVDVSKGKRVAFDLYLSDPALANLTFEMELRSPGGNDNNEARRRDTLKNCIIGTPVAGWNRVEISTADLTVDGTYDNTQLRHFKIFMPNGTGQAIGTAGTNYTFKIDNLHFSERRTTLDPVEGFDILVADGEKTQGWADCNDEGLPRLSLTAMADHGNVISTTYTGALHANGGYSHPSGGGTKPTNGIKTGLVVNAVDASDMKYFVFDLYVSNPALLEGTTFYLELTSAGKADTAETNWDKTLADLKGSALVKGWNRFYVDLSTGSGSTDWSRWNYMRFHNHSGLDLGTKSLTLAWDNVGFAKELPPEPEKPTSALPTLISVTNCDQLDGFATGDHLLLDTTNPSQGKASVARTFDGVVNSVAAIKFEYTIPNGKTYDATLMNQLSFDVWVSDPAAFAETKFELEIYGIKDGTLDGDNKEIVKRGTLADFKGDELVAGWNTISIDISTMQNKGATMEAYCWFRLFMNASTAGIEGQTSTIKLDNIYMTADAVVYEDYQPLLINYTSSYASAGTISPSYGSGNYMYSATYTNGSFDITKFSYIEFDVKIDNDVVNDIHFRMDITSSGKSDVNQITRTRSLSHWNDGDLPLNEWVHVRVPISMLQDSTGSFKSEKDANGDNVPDMDSIPDLTKINFFRFFSNNSTHITGDAYTGVYGCEMKNFTFTKELAGGEELVFDAETMVSGTHAAQFAGGTTSDVKLNSGGSLRDIDGDGDNEWVAVEKSVAGVNAGTGAIPISFSFEDTVRNAAYANLNSLRFDLYCNSESFLNHTFDFEMSSSRGSDVGEATGKYTIRSLIIEDLGDGWYTVDIPLSKLTGRSNGSKWSAPKAAFSANRFNFFRMFNHADLNYDAGLLVAVDNIRVTRTAADQVEEKFEIPAGAIPFTSSVLDFVDLNAGNNYFHNRTSRAREAKIGPNTLDATVYNLFCANLYLENYEELLDEGFCFEVTSANKPDSEENSINQAPLSAIFTRFDGQPLQNGNNYVYLDVVNSTAFNSHAADLTRVNFVRIFNQTNVLATKNAVAKLTDLHFANENILNVELAKNMEITGVSLNINDNASMNIIADIHPSLNATATLTIDGISTELTGVRVGAANQVVFTTPAFQENELAKTFTFELIAKTADGKVLSDTLENYSVKQYVVDMLDGMANGTVVDTDNGELSALLTDLLVYAAAVQKIEGETELVTDGVDLSNASTF
ncbi:MAG: hypothetical protein J6R04_06750, partial [Clostridia bacterium]|nr:hypothetical protein [Clostridia bacterium]